MVGVGDDEQIRIRMERHGRRLALVLRQHRVHRERLQVQHDDLALVVSDDGVAAVRRAVHQVDAVVDDEPVTAVERVQEPRGVRHLDEEHGEGRRGH